MYVATAAYKHHFLILGFNELTSPLHLLTLYRAFVAAGAAYDSLNLSLLYYITLHGQWTMSTFVRPLYKANV